MHTVRDYVQDFYSKHSSFLEKTYPGISPSILQVHFEEFSKTKSGDFTQTKSEAFFEEVLVGRPLEYIKREKFFYRSPFYVDERVLIPRNETEILVDDSVSFLKRLKKEEVHFVEVGVGSFALSLSVLIDINQRANLIGTDISKDALDVANINLFRNRNKIHPESKIELKLCDRLKEIQGSFDFIVSNPPYIKTSAKDLVHTSVLKTEPGVALFLEDEDYDKWFEELFASCSRLLNESGAFYMEGHEDTLEDLEKIADKYFTKTKLKNDYTGRLRFLYCYK